MQALASSLPNPRNGALSRFGSVTLPTALPVGASPFTMSASCVRHRCPPVHSSGDTQNSRAFQAHELGRPKVRLPRLQKSDMVGVIQLEL